MSFFKNIYDYFMGGNTKREDENEFAPHLRNYSENIHEGNPGSEMDIKLPQDFFNNIYGDNKPYNDDISGFHLTRNVPFFGDLSNLFQMIGQFEKVINEMDREFNGPAGFHIFSEDNFRDMRDGMFREPEKTLTGDKLINYYLNGNSSDHTYQGGKEILPVSDKESNDHQGDLIINNNNNKSDFTSTPYFKSQSQFFSTKIGQDGVAEITTILKDESGNEERTVRKVKLF